MLWEKLLPEKLLKPSSVCGLELVFSESGISCIYTSLKLSSGKLTLQSHGSCDTLEALPAELKKNKLSLVLCLSGKGIILKKINLPKDGYTLEECMSANFPAINTAEFYIQLYPQSDNTAYLSLLRKEQLDAVLAALSRAGYEIAEVLIGPAFISDVKPVTEQYNSLGTFAYSIRLSNECVEELAPLQAEACEGKIITVADLSLPAANSLGFGAGFLYLAGIQRQLNHDRHLTLFRIQSLEKSKVKVLAGGLISILFLACLLNFLLFSHYFSANAKLDSELNIYEGKYQQLNQLLSDYEKKKNLIEQAGILNNSPIAKHADMIAAVIPADVVLSDWCFYPAKKGGEEDSLQSFHTNFISIKGVCNKSLVINDWMNVLKAQNFIKEVNLEKFSYSSEGTSPNFEINIETQP
ncbi:MAG: hypothetical protein ACXVPQ_11695 [Bacteroidia bacterium]